jgi:hypothetical protein
LLYRFGDWLVASDLPCTPLPVVAQGSPDCVVRRAAGDARERRTWDHDWRTPDGDVTLTCSLEGSGYTIGVPGLATFAMAGDGRSVRWSPVGDPPRESLEHALVDQVLPRVLAFRGRLVLHAGAVATPHGALAVFGDAGAGKSTLVAALARRGATLLGDDGLVITTGEDGRLAVVPTYPGLRLLSSPLVALFGDASAGTPMVPGGDKKRVAPSATGIATSDAPVPLRALYRLETAGTIEVAPLRGHDAFLSLVRSSFQLHLDDAERTRASFDRIGALIDAVPVRCLAYPREFARLDAVCRRVIDDAATLA